MILLDTVSHYDESEVVKYTIFDHAHCYKTATDTIELLESYTAQPISIIFRQWLVQRGSAASMLGTLISSPSSDF